MPCLCRSQPHGHHLQLSTSITSLPVQGTVPVQGTATTQATPRTDSPPVQGKSTLANRLLGHERSLTGPEPGLTRDAVHDSFAWGGQSVQLVDTAGWMRRTRLPNYDDSG